MEPTKAVLARIVANPKVKLLDQVREVCRLKHFSLRTEQIYMAWARRSLIHAKQRAGEVFMTFSAHFSASRAGWQWGKCHVLNCGSPLPRLGRAVFE